jgi:trimeric autotransporter adhesin
LRLEEERVAANAFKPSINAASEELAKRRRQKMLQEQQQQQQQSSAVDLLYEDAKKRRENMEKAISKAAKEYSFQPDIGVNALRPLPEDREAARSAVVATALGSSNAIEEARKKAFFERLYSEAARARVRIEQTRKRLIQAEREAAQQGIVHRRRASSKSRSLSSGARGESSDGGAGTDDDQGEDHVGPVLHASFKDALAARKRAEEEYQAAIEAEASKKHMSSGSAKILSQMRARAFAGLYELLLQSQRMTAAQREEELSAQEAVEAAMKAMGEGGSTIEAAEALASVFAAGVETRGRSARSPSAAAVGGRSGTSTLPGSPAAVSDANAPAGAGGALQPLQRLSAEELARLLAVVDAHQQIVATAAVSAPATASSALLLEDLISRLSKQHLDLELAWSGVLDPSLAVYVRRALQMLKLRLYPGKKPAAPGASGSNTPSPVTFSQFCEALGRILEEVGGGSHIYLMARKEALQAAEAQLAKEEEQEQQQRQQQRQSQQRQRHNLDSIPTHERPDPEATFNPIINQNSAAIVNKLRSGGNPTTASSSAAAVTTGRSGSTSAVPTARLSKTAQDYEVRRRALEIQAAREAMLAHPYRPIPYGQSYDPKAALLQPASSSSSGDMPLPMPASRINVVQAQLSRAALPTSSAAGVSSASSTTSQVVVDSLKRENEDLAAVAKRVLARSNELAAGSSSSGGAATAAIPKAPFVISPPPVPPAAASSSSSSSSSFLSPPPAAAGSSSSRGHATHAAHGVAVDQYGYPMSAAAAPQAAVTNASFKRSPLQQINTSSSSSARGDANAGLSALVAEHEAEEAAIVPAVRERLLRQLSSINMGELEARIDRILSIDPSATTTTMATDSRGRTGGAGGGGTTPGGSGSTKKATSAATGGGDRSVPRSNVTTMQRAAVAPSVTKALFGSSQVRQQGGGGGQ